MRAKLKKEWEKAEIEAIEINYADVVTSVSDGSIDLPEIPF